ncbi:unnamed protein product [Aureobasidium uvarum]|uniref:Uncharacterized protein n=1 Tax=Aureobasidium uvarum TaxID=2773716 RepID=A0A9N8KKX8_9PEZI|nr:unnamed protein product [Aureobasidium uvarum]
MSLLPTEGSPAAMHNPDAPGQCAANINHQDGIILRQNAYADMRPFIEHLWEDRRAMCCNIYPDQFPRGTADKGATKEEEDAFLLGYFPERDLHLQGGRFLKQVLYAIAKFNEDSVLSQAEKWWKEYNFCSSSGMDVAQIRQVLDLHQAPNYPESFLGRVVLLISDGFRRFQSATANDMEPAPSLQEVVPVTQNHHQHQQQQKQRPRTGSIQGTSLLHGQQQQPYNARSLTRQFRGGRNRRPSMSPMIAPMRSSFPDFDANISFIDAQPYQPVGFPPDGYYPPPMFIPVPDTRMHPGPDTRIHPAPDYYYVESDDSHRRSGSFGQRGHRLPPRLDPNSFVRFSDNTQQRSSYPTQSYGHRGGHRSSFNNPNRARRSSFRSGDAWQGPNRETRSFERRIYSDHRGYAHPAERERNHARENRPHSDITGDRLEEPSPTDTKLTMESSEQTSSTRAVLPSLSEDGSIDNSSPKTAEDDSFQTAAETPTATPTEKVLCKGAQSDPHSPTVTNESDEDAASGAAVEASPTVTHTEEKLHGRNAESIPHSPTSTTESSDTASMPSIVQQLTAVAHHESQLTAPRSGPKQTESYSPFARRANTKKKDPKQKLGKSKSKTKPEHEPNQSNQIMVDTSVGTSSETREEQFESHELTVNPEDSDHSSTPEDPDHSFTSENLDRAVPTVFQPQDNDHAPKPSTKADDPKHHTESATPQMLSTLSSVTALLTGALSSMGSSKAKHDDTGSTVSQTEITSAAPKKKSKKKNKKKKKAKTTTPVLDDTSTETITNETHVGSPRSTRGYTLRESTNMLDSRLSSLNIKEGSIVELHENKIGYHTGQQQENLSRKHDELVEQSRRKLQEMLDQEKLLKQKK